MRRRRFFNRSRRLLTSYAIRLWRYRRSWRSMYSYQTPAWAKLEIYDPLMVSKFVFPFPIPFPLFWRSESSKVEDMKLGSGVNAELWNWCCRKTVTVTGIPNRIVVSQSCINKCLSGRVTSRVEILVARKSSICSAVFRRALWLSCLSCLKRMFEKLTSKMRISQPCR